MLLLLKFWALSARAITASLFAAALLLTTVSTAHARRVALVIGNAAYAQQPLANPVNDATAIAQALTDLGFAKVIRADNASKARMEAALTELAKEAAGAEMAVVYFAGHGTERDGRNYLIPVDAKLERAADLDLQAIALPTVLNQIAGATKLKLVILDASRNHIFPLVGQRRAESRGLARVEPEENTLVAYSAKHGTVAADGAGQQHNPFTAELLKHIATLGIDVRILFGRVTDAVRRSTANRQEPFIYGSLGQTEISLAPERTPPQKSTKQQANERLAAIEAEAKPNTADRRRSVEALPAAQANTERRIALVLGIDRYEHLPKLQKAVADARAVASVLKDDLGFTTIITGENLPRRGISQKLAELDGAIQPGDLVFLFFAGHGVAFGAENYLLPADLPKPETGQDGLVRDDGFSVDALIRRIKSRGAKTAFLVLDACRDNPFGEIGVRSLGLDRGLARVDAPQGVFVLFSAGLGQKALDRLPGNDASPTSVFTRHLIPALQTPGLTHVQIAKRVQAEVDRAARDGARHAQQPAYYDQVVGDFIFKPGRPPRDLLVQPPLFPTPPPPIAPTPSPKSASVTPPAQQPPKPVATVRLAPGLEAALEFLGRNSRGTEVTVSVRIVNKGDSPAAVLLVDNPTVVDNRGTAYVNQNVSGIANCRWDTQMCSGRGIMPGHPIDSYSQIEPGGELGVNLSFLSDQGMEEGKGSQASLAASLLYRIIRDPAADERQSNEDRQRGVRSTSLSFRNQPIETSR